MAGRLTRPKKARYFLQEIVDVSHHVFTSLILRPRVNLITPMFLERVHLRSTYTLPPMDSETT